VAVTRRDEQFVTASFRSSSSEPKELIPLRAPVGAQHARDVPRDEVVRAAAAALGVT
jgi:hypothetical protein